jgi:DNA-binding transcriptional ArsR family regulator
MSLNSPDKLWVGLYTSNNISRAQWASVRIRSDGRIRIGEQVAITELLTHALLSTIFNLMGEYQSAVLDKTFHALAHPVRREMLARLSHKSYTVLEMAEQFDLSLNGVSKHLKVLEQAELIRRDIQGRTHYCTLETDRLREAAGWLNYYRHFWEGRLDALERFVAKKQQDLSP